MAKILHLVMNPFTHDNRVLRAAKTSMDVGARGVVFAYWKMGSPTNEYVNGIRVRRFRLSIKLSSRNIYAKILKYLELAFRMIIAGIELRPDIIHANDLNTLPIALYISKFTGSKVIYDAHELNMDREVWSE